MAKSLDGVVQAEPPLLRGIGWELHCFSFLKSQLELEVVSSNTLHRLLAWGGISWYSGTVISICPSA